MLMMDTTNIFIMRLLLILTATILVNESANSPKSKTGNGSPAKEIYQEKSMVNDALPCEEHAFCNHPQKVCSCDPSCELFQDCCNFHSRNISWSDEQRSMVYHNKKCTVLRNIVFWVIDKCPRNASTLNTIHNSTQFFQKLPVTDEFNITYSNSGIAECNGVYNYLAWRMVISDAVHNCNIEDTSTFIDKFIVKMMHNKNFTLFNLTELLFESRCFLGYYPPEGRSSHYCQRDIVSSDDCSQIYRPVYNMAHDYIDNNLYRNLDCCIKLKKCKTRHLCLKRPLDPMNPFDDIRGDPKIKSSVVLLDLNKRSYGKDFAVQFVNIRYKPEFTFNVSNRIRREDLMSVYCLLRQYFENNKFKIEQTTMVFYEVHNSSQFLSYMSTVWFLLNSKRLLEVDSAGQIEVWLTSMEVEIDFLVSRTSNGTIFSKTKYFDHENISKSVIHKLSPSKYILTHFHSSLRMSTVCRHLNEANTSPRKWCQYLNVRVITDDEGSYVQWTCKLWVGKTGEKGPLDITTSSTTNTQSNELIVFWLLSFFFVFSLHKYLKTK